MTQVLAPELGCGLGGGFCDDATPRGPQSWRKRAGNLWHVVFSTVAVPSAALAALLARPASAGPVSSPRGVSGDRAGAGAPTANTVPSSLTFSASSSSLRASTPAAVPPRHVLRGASAGSKPMLSSSSSASSLALTASASRPSTAAPLSSSGVWGQWRPSTAGLSLTGIGPAGASELSPRSLIQSQTLVRERRRAGFAWLWGGLVTCAACLV